ncbi:uncharacterized protein DS421_11g322760 [Arachis hypogaea]|nr:uncharacterized protein DS421_11g322760 [Arachis hypogaea]
MDRNCSTLTLLMVGFFIFSIVAEFQDVVSEKPSNSAQLYQCVKKCWKYYIFNSRKREKCINKCLKLLMRYGLSGNGRKM